MNYTQSMPSGGKDNPQADIGVEIPRTSFGSRNHDARNQAPACNETSDRCILASSGWIVGYPSVSLASANVRFS
jgi:hypothetical protein